jgi:hypothetical protein
MFKPVSYQKLFYLFTLSSSLFTFSSCSPKVKIGLWAKTHQDAAMALGTWSANNSTEAIELLAVDCEDRKQFKKKITDALNKAPEEQPYQPDYDIHQRNNHYGNTSTSHSRDGFGDWCRKYPQAARKLRSHAKALCKTGLGILNGTYKIN